MVVLMLIGRFILTEYLIMKTEFDCFVETPVKKISKEQIEIWHSEGVKAARDFRDSEFRIIEVLKNMAECNGYYHYECDSLTRYARFALDLPENTIKNFVAVAYKSIEVPEMLEALKENKATVSKLRKVCPVITKENYEDWLAIVEEGSTRNIERLVAQEKPKSAIEDRMKFVGPDLIELNFGISEEEMDLLERAQDVLSSKLSSSASYRDILRESLKVLLEKYDPLKKAERAQARKLKKAPQNTKLKTQTLQKKIADSNLSVTSSKVSPNPSTHLPSSKISQNPPMNSNAQNPESKCATREVSRDTFLERRGGGRQYISATLKQAIEIRDESRCTHLLPNGSRCTNRRWLHIHHIKPVSEGGVNQLSNLELVCSSHHRMHHH